MNKPAAIFLLLVLVPLAGCATAVMTGAASGDRNGQMEASDSRIVRAVRTAIYRDPLLDDERIQVRCEAGVVTLTGIVAGRQQIDRAEEIVRNVEGVRGVNIALRARN